MNAEPNRNGAGKKEERTPEVQAAYEEALRNFTDADVQKYIDGVNEEGIPFAQVIEELEAIQREEEAKRTRQ